MVVDEDNRRRLAISVVIRSSNVTGNDHVPTVLLVAKSAMVDQSSLPGPWHRARVTYLRDSIDLSKLSFLFEMGLMHDKIRLRPRGSWSQRPSRYHNPFQRPRPRTWIILLWVTQW